jgi:hypothetical protein
VEYMRGRRDRDRNWMDCCDYCIFTHLSYPVITRHLICFISAYLLLFSSRHISFDYVPRFYTTKRTIHIPRQHYTKRSYSYLKSWYSSREAYIVSPVLSRVCPSRLLTPRTSNLIWRDPSSVEYSTRNFSSLSFTSKWSLTTSTILNSLGSLTSPPSCVFYMM